MDATDDEDTFWIGVVLITLAVTVITVTSYLFIFREALAISKAGDTRTEGLAPQRILGSDATYQYQINAS